MKASHSISILLADDDDGHAELIKDVLQESGLDYPFKRFSDGKEVWNFLVQEYANIHQKRLNFLLLLDVNMPIMDGVEVLRKIRTHQKMNTLPVIMLTTTDDPNEIQTFYHNGCNICISKPVDFNQFTDTIRQLGMFIKVIKL